MKRKRILTAIFAQVLRPPPSIQEFFILIGLWLHSQITTSRHADDELIINLQEAKKRLENAIT